MDENVADTGVGGVKHAGLQNGLQAVVQAVLIYRSLMWVQTPRMARTLMDFHQRVDLRLTFQSAGGGH